MSRDRMIVAITGQSGCGKSTLSAFYRSRGYTVIDCDEIARQIHDNADCQLQLRECFGRDIISGGVLDKKLLSRRAFASADGVQKLTDITHPFIIREILRLADRAFDSGEKIVFVDGAVIINHDFEKYCDRFVVVVAGEEVQCARLEKRDGITRQQAMERIKKQTPYSDMLKKADYVINNNKEIDSLIFQRRIVLKQIEKG